MEATMHGSLDKSGNNEDSIYRRWGLGLLALPALLAVTLIGLAIAQPNTSNWISEAVQAEFAGFDAMPQITPTQFARPSMEFRTVRAD
jgi:hypothetical protein